MKKIAKVIIIILVVVASMVIIDIIQAKILNTTPFMDRIMSFNSGDNHQKHNKKNNYLPEAKNDKVFTSIGPEQDAQQPRPILHKGDGYTISLPGVNYRYEIDRDEGELEETWEYIGKDDVGIKVTTYKNTDEPTARGKFLRDNDDYIFEDLMGYSLCGMEPNGDTLWFNLHQTGSTVYIVSWEYSKNTDEDVKTELANIAQTFTLAN